jgi:hypothetical protein
VYRTLDVEAPAVASAAGYPVAEVENAMIGRLVTLAFLVSAAGLMARSSWWPSSTWGAALASLILCVLWWKDASLGIGVDIVIMVVLARVRARPAGQLVGRHPQAM